MEKSVHIKEQNCKNEVVIIKKKYLKWGKVLSYERLKVRTLESDRLSFKVVTFNKSLNCSVLTFLVPKIRVILPI